jgi:hypothetical protein
MATFVLCHRHEPAECRFAFAAWRGFDSPLRHATALASCAVGGPPAEAGLEVTRVDDAAMSAGTESAGSVAADPGPASMGAGTPAGPHQIFWTVQAADAAEALGYLPAYLARRTRAVHVSEVPIP